MGKNGVPPFTYYLNSIAFSGSVSNLTVGSYPVTVIDNAGCSITTTVAIGIAPPLQVR